MSRAIKLEGDVPFLMPAGIIGRPDVSRVLREIEKVDYDLETQALRNPQQPLTIPAMSRGLVEIVTVNNIAIEDLGSRKILLQELRKIKEHSPVVQLTFASDPDIEITIQLVGWIREHLHPTALIAVGMQPSIVGGVVVRTPDHIYDFSLRNRFKRQIPEMVSFMRTIGAKAS